MVSHRKASRPFALKDKMCVWRLTDALVQSEILPSSLPQSPSFYLAEESSTRALLAPYLQRASHLLDIVLDSIPAFAHRFKDIFDLAGSRKSSFIHPIGHLVTLSLVLSVDRVLICSFRRCSGFGQRIILLDCSGRFISVHRSFPTCISLGSHHHLGIRSG